MDVRPEPLFEMALDAAVPSPSGPPAGLWQRISAATSGAAVDAAVATSAARRHPAWSRPEPSGTSPIEAFARTVAELGDLLGRLAPADWTRRTRVDDATVRDVAMHLVGVERYLLGQVGRRTQRPADRREDHWPVAREAAADLAGSPDRAVARQWWCEVLELLSACAELGPDHPVRSHHLPGTVRSLLVIRTFELWTHGDDIRQAVGRPLDLLDEPRLSLMVGDLMGALSIGTVLTGMAHPGRTARFHLHGPGGGTFDVPLAFGEDPGTPDIVITTGTVELCRVAANRLAPGALGAEVEGDASLLEPVLLAAAAFAAD